MLPILFALADVAAVLLIAVPWLWPLTWGPLAAAEPYLVAAATAAVLLAYLPWRGARRAFTLAALGWALAATLSGVIALLQYFHLESWGWPLINLSHAGYAFGNLRQPNLLATHLVIGLLVAWWLTRDRELPWLVTALAALVMLAGLAASASRVGTVELIALALLVVYWAWRKERAVFQFAPADERVRVFSWRLVAALAVAAVLLYLIAGWLLSLSLRNVDGLGGRNLMDHWEHGESACGSRVVLWRDVLWLIVQKPLTGWGWGNLAWAHYMAPYEEVGLPRFCHILDNAHNLPLHLAVTLGVPATAAIGALALWLIWRGRPWGDTDPARQLAWGVLLAIGIHSLVEYPLWYGPFQIAALLCLWLLWATRHGADAAAPARWRWPCGTLALALLAFIGYAGWDYWRVGQLFLAEDQRAPIFRHNTMGQAKRSWLFAGIVNFAEVTTRSTTRENAPIQLREALETLHFSPEPRVIEKVIASAALLSENGVASEQLARFKASFPDDLRAWNDENHRISEDAQQQFQGAASQQGLPSSGSAAADAGKSAPSSAIAARRAIKPGKTPIPRHRR
ncbi:MAG: Wzy polymerase domain-containing protein [Burkholderiaceae bacterium]|nr:Wzy polymerase domain-containing protein [Burkholderiaceae bacterium]